MLQKKCINFSCACPTDKWYMDPLISDMDRRLSDSCTAVLFQQYCNTVTGDKCCNTVTGDTVTEDNPSAPYKGPPICRSRVNALL